MKEISNGCKGMLMIIGYIFLIIMGIGMTINSIEIIYYLIRNICRFFYHLL